MKLRQCSRVTFLPTAMWGPCREHSFRFDFAGIVNSNSLLDKFGSVARDPFTRFSYTRTKAVANGRILAKAAPHWHLDQVGTDQKIRQAVQRFPHFLLQRYRFAA